MKNKILKVLIIILFLNLPILDMLRATPFKDFEIFGFAFIELINIILIGVSFCITLTKCSKKNILFLGLYFLLLVIYVCFHYFNMLHFDTNIYSKTQFNFFRETFYILRAYVLPIILLFVLILNREIFNKKFYLSTIKYLTIFISFSIIILDVLQLSYPSYDDIVDLKYAPSILQIFKYSGNPQDLLAKGWFDSANEISIILFALLPINIFILYNEKKIHNFILLIVQLFAMILLGTRTSAYGSILIPLFCLVLYIFFLSINKNKWDFSFISKFILTIVITCIIFICAPFRQFKREIDPSRLEISNEEKLSELLNEYKTDDERVGALSNKLYDFGINAEIEEVYPIDNDLEFWINISKRDLSINNDNRILKHDVIRRIKERNNNFGDTLFGMGFTLNFMDVEMDYVYQYYLFGIIGIIMLMGIYFISYFKSIIIFFKKFKSKFNFGNVILFMPVMLELIVAYFSGHAFGMVTPMFVLALNLGILRIYVVGDDDEI